MPREFVSFRKGHLFDIPRPGSWPRAFYSRFQRFYTLAKTPKEVELEVFGERDNNLPRKVTVTRAQYDEHMTDDRNDWYIDVGGPHGFYKGQIVDWDGKQVEILEYDSENDMYRVLQEAYRNLLPIWIPSKRVHSMDSRLAYLEYQIQKIDAFLQSAFP